MTRFSGLLAARSLAAFSSMIERAFSASILSGKIEGDFKVLSSSDVEFLRCCIKMPGRPGEPARFLGLGIWWVSRRVLGVSGIESSGTRHGEGSCSSTFVKSLGLAGCSSSNSGPWTASAVGGSDAVCALLVCLRVNKDHLLPLPSGNSLT